MALLPPFFLDTVVAIGSPTDQGNRWIGTGFFYMRVTEALPDGSADGHAYLVTNRHVVSGQKRIMLRCNPEFPTAAKEFAVALVRPDGSPVWCAHRDEAIDVVVVPINFNLLTDQGMRVQVIRSDTSAMRRDEMKAGGVSEGDAAYVIGFPMGMVGEDPDAAIVRGGTIARIRDCLDSTNDEFLVDCSVFPGNSGGPVLLQPHGFAIRGTQAQSNAVLIGIVKSYVPYHDFAVSQQTGRLRVVFEENSDLAAAHPVDFIESAIDMHLATLPLTQAEEPESIVPSGNDEL